MQQLGRLLFLGTSILAVAHASTLLDVTTTIAANGASSQTGRLSRNGIAQDWSGTELFPGVINSSTTYSYTAFLVPVGSSPFIQIEVTTESASIFFAAYDTSYLPDSAGAPNFGFNTNWLGDAGASLTDSIFRVVIPTGHNLLVIGSTTVPTSGEADSFHLTVEGFESAVPEPGSSFLAAAGLLLVTISRWRSAMSRKL